MATLAELRQSNEGIEEQIRQWQGERRAAGQDHTDWVSFRDHVRQIGAPDPGDAAPDEFYASGHGDGGGSDDRSGTPDGKQISEVNSLHPAAVDLGDTATWPPQAGSGSTTSHWPVEKPEGG